MQLKRHSCGFTLVELMIAMLIGIIFSICAIKMFAGTINTSARSVQMVKLSQELRTAMQLVARDIRRSGILFDPLANYQATQALTSGITIGALSEEGDADCLQVTYQDTDGTDVNAVYRHIVTDGVGSVAGHFAAGSTCATGVDADGWVEITNPEMMNVSNFSLTLNNQTIEIGTNPASGNAIQMIIERVAIQITGVLHADTDIARTIQTEIRLRNEYVTT